MDLESLQREMAAAVMQPLTKDENMRSTAPDGRPMAEVAASFIAPNSRLTSFERLEIYNRQYWYRVLGALAEDFPALRALVGERRFEALSIAYLTEHPSRSFTLRNLGSKLPDWLTAHAEHAGRRHRLAVDLARMEWAFVEAFDAPERDPLTQRQIAALQGESRLTLQPCLQLVALSFPADELVLELHKREKRQTSEAGVAHEDSGADAEGIFHLNSVLLRIEVKSTLNQKGLSDFIDASLEIIKMEFNKTDDCKSKFAHPASILVAFKSGFSSQKWDYEYRRFRDIMKKKKCPPALSGFVSAICVVDKGFWFLNDYGGRQRSWVRLDSIINDDPNLMKDRLVRLIAKASTVAYRAHVERQGRDSTQGLEVGIESFIPPATVYQLPE